MKDCILSRRDPNSSIDDMLDAYFKGYKTGYDSGFEKGKTEVEHVWQEECQRLRDVLRAILDAGEAPAHGM